MGTALSILIKSSAIISMLAFVIFALMAIGIIPSERINKFLRKHEKVQIAIGILIAIGLSISFLAALGLISVSSPS